MVSREKPKNTHSASLEDLSNILDWLDDNGWEKLDGPDFNDWLKAQGIDREGLMISKCRRTAAKGL